MLWLFVMLLFLAGCIEEKDLYNAAENLGLNNFSKCMNSSVDNILEKDKLLAKKYNIRGTPSFVINGQVLVGAQPYNVFKKAFENARSRTFSYNLSEYDIWWGNKNAPIIVIEFSSPNCPYCRRFHNEVYPLIKKDYIDKGDILWIYKNYELGHGSDERTKIKAIICAAKESKVEDMLKVIFQ